MKNHNANNERIKRRYFNYLMEAKRQSESTIDAVASALASFEMHNKYRDFKAFHHRQAVAFKKRLAEQVSDTTGKPLSKATLYSTLMHLKRFFQWLSQVPGYKSSVQYHDAEYFSMSDNDARIATARRTKPVPSMEQIRYAISLMPNSTEIERRDRALVAFTILTGARDSAIASIKLKHLDMATGSVYQDAREVNTKFRKTFTTYFFPVGDEIRQILSDWVDYLKYQKHWSGEDPLFPSTHIGLSNTGQFEVAGLRQTHWSNTTPIRSIVKDCFHAAGLPYFNPHSFRNTLVQLGQEMCKTPEQFKAWSQNLGHEDVLTTMVSYGAVSENRQKDIFHTFRTTSVNDQSRPLDIGELAILMREFLDKQGARN